MCAFAAAADEWGRYDATDRGLFEKLSLEGFQSGLSWLTILRKRENFRAAFAGPGTFPPLIDPYHYLPARKAL